MTTYQFQVKWIQICNKHIFGFYATLSPQNYDGIHKQPHDSNQLIENQQGS